MGFELGKLELFGLDLGSLWRRWWRGINSLLPVPLADIFLRSAPVVRVSMENGQLALAQLAPGRPACELVRLHHAEFELLEDNSLHEQLMAGMERKLVQLELVLPASQVLRREVMVPAAARGNLRQALGFQISKLTPFTREQVFYDVIECPANASSGMLEVELLVVSRSFAQKWLEQVARVTGLPVARLQVVMPEGQKNTTNLLGQAGAPANWFRRLNRNSILVLMLVLSLALAVVAPVVKLRTLVIQDKQEIAALNQRLAETRETWFGLQQNVENLEFMLDKYVNHGRPGMILDELARLLPDRVYLTSMVLEKNRIELSGQGTEVVDLIDVLNKSELFEQARFASAITRGRDNQDVFTISMQLATGAAGEQP